MKTIQLTNSTEVALVDDEDYAYLNQFRWLLNSDGYVIRYDNNNSLIYMHREVIALSKKEKADHKNTLRNDNQKLNLRPATTSQNGMNRKKQSKPCSSKYKGVYWEKRDNMWRARIKLVGKRINLGSFLKEIDAALAYNKAAIKYFGQFAKLNEV